MKSGPKKGDYRLDITGQTYGKLTAINYDKIKTTYKNSYWVCKCVCGNIVSVSLCHLRSGHTKSCGCSKTENTVKHGKSGTAEYGLLVSARHRAKISGLDFNLELSDIVIPDRCPIFGNKFHKNPDRRDSPSLDRIDSDKGYIKGNVWVISRRANIIKNDATPAELRMIADAVEDKLNEVRNG